MGHRHLQYHIDNIALVSASTPPTKISRDSASVLAPKFLSAEPLAGNVIAVTTQGAVNMSQITVFLNGKVGINSENIMFAN
jgi:hypothetical protein